MSDANGYDLSMWERCCYIMHEYGITHKIKSEHIILYENDLIMGGFTSVKEVFYFLTGYSQGFENGKVIGGEQ